jgi:hypothetical protein
MNEIEFMNTMQKKVAVSAVGPSTLRGNGEGVLHATQQALQGVDLFKLPVDGQEDFYAWLDEQTTKILKALPIKGKCKPWGAARKALNLFLRDALYNRYLCKEYGIDRAECWLEIPLDSAVAKGLMKRDKQGVLPRWPRLKYLAKDDNDKYQKFADMLAAKEGVARVHLDMKYFLENR